jgi:hypothetical protein
MSNKGGIFPLQEGKRGEKRRKEGSFMCSSKKTYFASSFRNAFIAYCALLNRQLQRAPKGVEACLGRKCEEA